MPPLADLTRKRFGRLRVLGRDTSRKSRRVYWRCRCRCGNETSVDTTSLTSGHTKSCGCYKAERVSACRRTHGLSDSPEYRVWKNLITRCENPNGDRYYRYGGRGIKVCARWRRSFAAFFRDMGPRPSADHQIGRKDNDLNYSPGNCRWETRVDNARNTSRTRWLTVNGVTLSLAEWAEKTGQPYMRIHRRLALGWSATDAVLTAKKKPKPEGLGG